MKLIFFTLYFLAIISCSPKKEPTPEKKGREREALQAIKALGGLLKNELQTASKTSLDNALSVCHLKAMKLSQEISEKKGIELGRVSQKNRNPLNYVKDWMKETVEKYHQGEIKSPYEVLSVSQGKKGILMPIKTQGLCLNCHGSRLSPQVSEKIKKLYPKDLAIGYKAGEIRGFFWAIYPEESR